tara:strand:+ start:655 stop:873 length:219 start_codon:yes stop_codon:yes gene_type:complete
VLQVLQEAQELQAPQALQGLLEHMVPQVLAVQDNGVHQAMLVQVEALLVQGVQALQAVQVVQAIPAPQVGYP